MQRRKPIRCVARSPRQHEDEPGSSAPVTDADQTESVPTTEAVLGQETGASVLDDSVVVSEDVTRDDYLDSDVEDTSTATTDLPPRSAPVSRRELILGTEDSPGSPGASGTSTSPDLVTATATNPRAVTRGSQTPVHISVTRVPQT